MKDILVELIINVVATIIVAWIGVGAAKTKITHTHLLKTKKTGKWIILIAVAVIIFGLITISNNNNPKLGLENESLKFWVGFASFGYGIILFIIGKIVAWFQRP